MKELAKPVEDLCIQCFFQVTSRVAIGIHHTCMVIMHDLLMKYILMILEGYLLDIDQKLVR